MIHYDFLLKEIALPFMIHDTTPWTIWRSWELKDLHSLLGYPTGEIRALQLIILAACEAVD